MKRTIVLASAVGFVIALVTFTARAGIKNMICKPAVMGGCSVGVAGGNPANDCLSKDPDANPPCAGAILRCDGNDEVAEVCKYGLPRDVCKNTANQQCGQTESCKCVRDVDPAGDAFCKVDPNTCMLTGQPCTVKKCQ